MGWGTSFIGGIISGIIKPLADEISSAINNLDESFREAAEEEERESSKKEKLGSKNYKKSEYKRPSFKQEGSQNTASKSRQSKNNSSTGSTDPSSRQTSSSSSQRPSYSSSGSSPYGDSKKPSSGYRGAGVSGYHQEQGSGWSDTQGNYRYVKNSRAVLRFSKPDFGTYEQGLRGMAFPYALMIPSALGKEIVVTGKFATLNGDWVKSLIPELADGAGDLIVSERFTSTKRQFEVESYLFVPFGVLDVDFTQNICLNLNVFIAENGRYEQLLRFVHTFEYFVYKNDPREYRQSRTYNADSNYVYTSSSSKSKGNKEQPGFEELIGLIAQVIKADGITSSEEVRTVIDFFERSKEVDKELLKQRLKYNLNNLPDIDPCCQTLKKHYNTQTLLTFVALFLNIAVSDGFIPFSEIKMIENIATKLGISSAIFSAMKADFMPNETSLWDLFDLTPKASMAQLKRAYREKCKQYHPDKYERMAPEIRKIAEERFKDIQVAYEELLKEYL